jgi:hypothetical protein
MTERFCTVLDWVDVGFIPDDLLDELAPTPLELFDEPAEGLSAFGLLALGAGFAGWPPS